MEMRAFVSYDRQDSLLSHSIVEALESTGRWEIIRDVTNPTPGLPLSDRLRNEIEHCDIFLIILTENSRRSSWVGAELAWAVAAGKIIVPVVQKGVRPDEIPAFPATVEYIEYDPADYVSCLESLKSFSPYSSHATVMQRTQAGQSVVTGVQSYDFLSSDEIRKVFWLTSPQSWEPLQGRLERTIQSIIYDFLTTPTVSCLLNIGALKTDDYAVILRVDTLHALLHAARQQKPAGMRLAGYEAGALYGIAVIEWLLAKTAEIRQRPALPVNSRAVIEACLEIDRTAGMGRRIELGAWSEGLADHGWAAKLLIQHQFLSEPHDVTRRRDHEWSKAQEFFWQGYLEGSFTAALGTWYWIQRSGGQTEPRLYAAHCTALSTDSDSDLLFQVEVGAPEYEKTFVSLQQEVLGPHLQKETTRIVARARAVLDEFVRELAGVEEGAGENITGALIWLARTVPDVSKEAVARLQSTRQLLHKGVHVSAEPNERMARSVVRMTTAVVLQACRDVHLTASEAEELAKEIRRRS